MIIDPQNEAFCKIQELKNWVSEQVKGTSISDFPVSSTYNEGLAEPYYKITIEVEQQDSYIDKNGVKWVRQIQE